MERRPKQTSRVSERHAPSVSKLPGGEHSDNTPGERGEERLQLLPPCMSLQNPRAVCLAPTRSIQLTSHFASQNFTLESRVESPEVQIHPSRVTMSCQIRDAVLMLCDGQSDSFLRSRLPALSSMSPEEDTDPARARAYVCQDFSCSLPLSDPQELRTLLLDTTLPQ
ncbi:hypothetical protein WMY93_032013 [Mugilogobius chulae]|uniref:Uncharacterized protein n=1 Tax=Mugilogobius chulae TaxID=88201 RepID=A0AAW0MGZ6_9GOBI